MPPPESEGDIRSAAPRKDCADQEAAKGLWQQGRRRGDTRPGVRWCAWYQVARMGGLGPRL